MLKGFALIDKYPRLFVGFLSVEIPDGWVDLVDDLLAKLDAIGGINIAQIKSKFAGLRVYFDCEDIEAYDPARILVDEAEKKSTTICEFTGREGAKLYKTKGPNIGWLYTCHPDHAATVDLVPVQ
jgi:hypothetical protein